MNYRVVLSVDCDEHLEDFDFKERLQEQLDDWTNQSDWQLDMTVVDVENYSNGDDE